MVGVGCALIIAMQHAQLVDLRAARAADQAETARRALAAAGAIAAKDVPAPPVPSQVRDQVERVRAAVPAAAPERTADVSTGWLVADGPVLPCGNTAPHAAGDSPDAPYVAAPDGASGGALLRVGDRFRIHLVSVDLTTRQGATGTVGEGELVRFDGASLGRGPLDQDSSTVWRRQSAQERPAWFAMPMVGVTSRARAWAGVAIGRGRWGGVIGAAWKPGDAEYVVGVAARW